MPGPTEALSRTRPAVSCARLASPRLPSELEGADVRRASVSAAATEQVARLCVRRQCAIDRRATAAELILVQPGFEEARVPRHVAARAVDRRTARFDPACGVAVEEAVVDDHAA